MGSGSFLGLLGLGPLELGALKAGAGFIPAHLVGHLVVPDTPPQTGSVPEPYRTEHLQQNTLNPGIV